MQKSSMLKKEAAIARRQWYLVDATDLVLGRLSVKVADILRGKNKVDYTPNVDAGDYVIIVNSDKVVLTGQKALHENWYNHSHYIGGLRTRSGEEMISKYSDELIRRSVKGMLPKNKLSKQILNKLFIYKNDKHPHEAQQPTILELKLK
ncbi:ribosomal protein L13 [Ureaplasma urealyticum serovar 13 str. ATCC 33698]|uniref:50S ribosomal protein L13 n=1 Tax=Ureaplasma urealyticum TaxID=2130 RepID=UPI00017220C0|nr:50S ribosomal protein L13 [Ureaplasma urealyticum]EDT49660.1 ribosomal protein L13 [Ureaplasma urealyticum serovar 13 str. ATCC 33698]